MMSTIDPNPHAAPVDRRPTGEGVAHGPILHLANVPFNTIWQRPQQIAAGLSEHADVVYADPNRSVVQFLRSHHRLRPPEHLPPRLSVFTPPAMLPFARQFGLLNRLNYQIVGRRLDTFLRDRGLTPAVIVATFPDQYDLLDRFPGVPVVYDLMDEPYLFVRSSQRERYRRLHQLMLARTDLLVTSARVLADRYAGTVKRCVWISNGVRRELVDELRDVPPDPAIARLPGPRVGYVGMISHWFDFAAVRAIAERLPGGSVVLVGPRDVEPPPLPPNVHLTGPVPHQHLARTLAAFDIGLIPFVRSAEIDAVNPVKLYEYLAAGLRVLASDFEEIRQYRPMVSTYADPGEAARSAEGLVGPVADADARRLFARGHLWAEKAARFAAELFPTRPAVV
jgi:glycosyltransferase involved in cell wall biosynthesis